MSKSTQELIEEKAVGEDAMVKVSENMDMYVGYNEAKREIRENLQALRNRT